MHDRGKIDNLFRTKYMQKLCNQSVILINPTHAAGKAGNDLSHIQHCIFERTHSLKRSRASCMSLLISKRKIISLVNKFAVI